MTTLVGVQGDGWAVVGFDNNVADDDGGRKYSLPAEMGKFCEVGPYLMGAAGDLRAVNILSYNFHPPVPSRTDAKNLDMFIGERFVPALQRCFDLHNFGKSGNFEADIMIAVAGRIYEIGGTYDIVRDREGLYGLGSGGSYALGALAASLRGSSRSVGRSREAASEAVKIAASFDSGTSSVATTLVQYA